MRDILMTMLKSLKFEATATDRFSEGFKELETAVKHRPYDLIIIDNKLPDAVGAEVCCQIKNVNPKKETKTILISGFSITTNHFDQRVYKPAIPHLSTIKIIEKGRG